MVSITFENPQYLWFLFAVPLFVVTHFFLLRHNRRKAMKFANFMAIKRVTGERLITKNYTVLILRMIIIICAILAVAQTVVWYEGETNENEYVIALDTSASMTAEDVLPTRLDAAKVYGKAFIDTLDGNTRVGLVSFSGVTFIEEPLTLKRGDLFTSLDRMEPTASGTDIPGAIITSTNMLSSTDRGRAIILISDGSNTIETFASRSIQRATGYATLYHVKVYTIGVGTESDAPIGYLPNYYNVSATYNFDNLEFIANETGGEFYKASSAEELQQAYDDIKANDRTSTIKMDLTVGLMLICLLLLMVEWGLLNTRFRSLP
jgi:Ca-activated chloride channel homolog